MSVHDRRLFDRPAQPVRFERRQEFSLGNAILCAVCLLAVFVAAIVLVCTS